MSAQGLISRIITHGQYRQQRYHEHIKLIHEAKRRLERGAQREHKRDGGEGALAARQLTRVLDRLGVSERRVHRHVELELVVVVVKPNSAAVAALRQQLVEYVACFFGNHFAKRFPPVAKAVHVETIQEKRNIR